MGRLHRLAAPSCPAQLPLSHALQMKRGISSSWHTLALEQALNTALLVQLPHLKHEVSSERNKGHAQSHRASQRHQKAQSQDSPLHAASAPKGGNVALRTGLQHTHTHTHTHRTLSQERVPWTRTSSTLVSLQLLGLPLLRSGEKQGPSDEGWRRRKLQSLMQPRKEEL